MSTWAEIFPINRKNNMSILAALFLIGLTMFILGTLAMKLGGPSDSLGGFGMVVVFIGVLIITHTSCYKASEEQTLLDAYRGTIDVEELGQERGWEKDTGE